MDDVLGESTCSAGEFIVLYVFCHQVSLVQYADEPHLEFSLRCHTCLPWLIDDIRKTKYMAGTPNFQPTVLVCRYVCQSSCRYSLLNALFRYSLSFSYIQFLGRRFRVHTEYDSWNISNVWRTVMRISSVGVNTRGISLLCSLSLQKLKN